MIRRHQIRRPWATLLLALSLVACSSPPALQDAAVAAEPLLIEHYFAGRTRAEGVLFDRDGAVSRQFSVDINGVWDADSQTLTLSEDFAFLDGEISHREWVIRKTGEHSYRGTAADVIGEAIGESRGNALHWRYTLDVPWRNRQIAIDMDDRMVLRDGVLLNRATMRKFGLTVGEIFISFHRLPAP